MNEFKSILVVADIDNVEQPALARAFEIVRGYANPAPITFFLSIYDFSYGMNSMLSSDERDAMRKGFIYQKEQWMKEVAEPYLHEGIQFTIKVIWHRRPFEAIIGEVFEGKHDILLKGTRQHDDFEYVFFTPTDWHLLRKSPCPVLLVKNKEWSVDAKIVASVNVASENETHIKLNDTIVEQGLKFAKHFNRELYLVNASPIAPDEVIVDLPEFNATSYSEAIKVYHQKAMKSLMEKYDIDFEHTRVGEGSPEYVIPKEARKLNAGLVILGTTGRTGLSAAFIGNTAESVLDQINCDVLALKPDGYISPLNPAKS